MRWNTVEGYMMNCSIWDIAAVLPARSLGRVVVSANFSFPVVQS